MAEPEDQWQQFDGIEATFRPKALGTLKPEVVDWIGVRLQWHCVWRIDEDYGGPYVGQCAWSPLSHHRDGGGFPVAWVPTEDLTDKVRTERLTVPD